MIRRTTTQSLSWLWDQHNRGLLDLDPPYQRRSVWNQKYRDYFVDSVLNNFPSPPLFLFEQITPDGVATYSVVDGKQRLTTMFAFVKDEFPVGDLATMTSIRGRYFKDVNDELRKAVWGYGFLIEYLDRTDESFINNIFDRLNRNVARLSRQELRHARYYGSFIEAAEELAAWTAKKLPTKFPAIIEASRKQMKDVELTSELLLLTEFGPKSMSQDDLDAAFSDRDESWDEQDEVVADFKTVIEEIRDVCKADDWIAKSRLRNQADFYSLFGAILALLSQPTAPKPSTQARRLRKFTEKVVDEVAREGSAFARDYYEAARSASNDLGPRQTRIDIILAVLQGKAKRRLQVG